MTRASATASRGCSLGQTPDRALLLAIFDNCPDAIFVYDADGDQAGRIIAANRVAERTYGYANGELEGMRISQLLACPDSEDWSIREAGSFEPTKAESEHRRKDGGLFYVEVTSFVVHIGGQSCCVAYVRDITARKATEKMIRQFQLAVENGMQGISRLDTKGRFVNVQCQYARMLGYEPDELVGSSWRVTVDSADQHIGEAAYAKMLANGRAETKCLAVRKDGSVFYKHILLVQTLEEDGNHDGHYCFMRDVTERKKADGERNHLQAQLRHSQKMDAVGQLAAGVAHEFNNILVGVLGNAEVLSHLNEELPLQGRQPLVDIQRAGLRAAKLTRQLLSFARKENPDHTIFDLNLLIANSKEMLRKLLDDRLQLETDLSQEVLCVAAAESVLETALINLSINARDAMGDGGKLTIRTDLVKVEYDGTGERKAGEYVRLTLSDNGCGMRQEHQERIFEPFFTTKPIGQGTGLGLSTVFAEISKLGGFIDVDSTVGVGTNFQIHIPHAIESKSDRTRRPVPQVASVKGKTILVCDDEEIVLSSLCSMLRCYGYSVVSALGGEAAMEVVQQHPQNPDLLLTDISMPCIDGVQLAARLRKQIPGLKVLFTSGYGECPLEAINDPNVAYVEKPVGGHVLTQYIQRLLDSKSIPSAC